MPKLVTTASFIKKAESVHKNKYQYVLVDYINTQTKVKILCDVHGMFEQTPHMHLAVYGCRACRKDYREHLRVSYDDALAQGLKKTCSVCGGDKTVDMFYKQKRGIYGVKRVCCMCEKLYQTDLYHNNLSYRSSTLERAKNRWANDPEYRKRRTQKRHSDPKYIERQKEKERKKELMSDPEYVEQQRILRNTRTIDSRNKRLSCPEYRKQYNEKRTRRYKERCDNDPEYRRHETRRQVVYEKERKTHDGAYKTTQNIRSGLRDFIRNTKFTKEHSSMKYLGCNSIEYGEHLQQTAITNGYLDFDINNYSGKDFHIDHIIPFKAVIDGNATLEYVCHYSNHQILSSAENLSKNDSYPLLEDGKMYELIK